MTATVFCLPRERTDLHIQDRVYGDIVFNKTDDALLIDLISSPSFDRLKHGISALVGSLASETAVTRYEHCIGACWLVRSLGASMEEQASALLHDVSHLALSHVADSVFNYVVHEVDKPLFCSLYPDLGAIIAAHGYDPEHIFDEDNFTLLEQKAPLLCGDRTDYALRDSMSFGLLAPDRATAIFENLVAVDGEICCQDTAIARELATVYLAADALAWSNPVQGAYYEYTALAYKTAYEAGHLTRLEMWQLSDVDLWTRLISSPLPAVRLAASMVTPSLQATEIGEDDELGESGEIELRMWLKPRVIDPSVVVEGRKVPLSELDHEFRDEVRRYKASKSCEKRFRVEL
ncbi:hypothetical protein RQP46_006583 [Phenoliferia psychrophenolica]